MELFPDLHCSVLDCCYWGQTEIAAAAFVPRMGWEAHQKETGLIEPHQKVTGLMEQHQKETGSMESRQKETGLMEPHRKETGCHQMEKVHQRVTDLSLAGFQRATESALDLRNPQESVQVFQKEKD